MTKDNHQLGKLDLTGIPPAVPPLRRRLELAQLVTRLVEAEPDLAPRAAVYDLADSLADLFAEMQGEGVGLETIAELDISDVSGHWARAQRFISIAGALADPDAPEAEARQRLMVASMLLESKGVYSASDHHRDVVDRTTDRVARIRPESHVRMLQGEFKRAGEAIAMH